MLTFESLNDRFVAIPQNNVVYRLKCLIRALLLSSSFFAHLNPQLFFTSLQTVNHGTLRFVAFYVMAMPTLFAEPLAPRAELPQKLEEIVVRGQTEPEDFRTAQKTPIQKMREKLEKSVSPRILQLDEFKSFNGTRTAQVAVGGRIFCIEERRGQIDFSGMGKGGSSMIPLAKPDCR